jgi:type IV pilus assembly protein PilQ
MTSENRIMTNNTVGSRMLVIHQFKTMMKWLCVSSMALTTVNIFAADLQSLGYSSLPGEKVQLMLTFSEPVDKPNTFSIDDPARVVLDFADVANKLDRKTQQINIGETNSVSIIEAGERTRMVINLAQKVPYTIEQEGNVILVTVDGDAKKSMMTYDDGAHNVTEIDFRRGEKGEARLMIHLDDDSAPVDVHQERDTIVVDLTGVSLPENLQRRLDVVDFGTPVQIIDSVQSGKNTKLTLTTSGKFEHLAYQSEDVLVIEVKPLTDDLIAEDRIDEFGYQGEQLSLNFQNIEVRAVLQLLADFTGYNLVTSDTVQGNLTLRLKNVPWDQALDIILKTKGLAMRQNGNILLIAPAAEIAAREKQELAAKKQLVELESLYSEIIEVNFAKATDLSALLQSGQEEGSGSGVTGFLSGRGSVTVDERTNSLLLRDTADQLVQIRKLITKLDIPIRQVLIESRIVIANNDFTKELGVRFGTSASITGNQANFSNIASSGSLNGTTQILNGETLEQADRLNVNLPVANAAGTFALALAKLPLGAILELELSAMQEEGQGEIISSPRVITSNQKTATIEQGTEIPYQEASSSGATSVSFKEAVLKLEVTPQITPDDRVVMDLEVNKDEVGAVFLGVPSIDTRSVKTQVLVDNGETVVLGGIYEQRKTKSSRRVPFFGDLPYVGFLFKTNTNEDIKRELLIFVTPKIIKDSLKF